MQAIDTQTNDQLTSMLYKGSTKQVVLPSTRVITIREQNGGDDDIISRIGDTEGHNVLVFLANIIQQDATTGKKPTIDDIRSWGVKDKYYALLQSRIFSLGSQLKWKHICGDSNCARNKPTTAGVHRGPFPVTEDLINYGDGSDAILSPDYVPFSPYSVTPYPTKTESTIELKLTSGKLVKYNILDSGGELERLQASEDARTHNFQFIIRKLAIKLNNAWVLVRDFQVFSPRDMVEMRASLEANDKEFVPITTVTCPTCGNADYVNILLLPDFFYPLEI